MMVADIANVQAQVIIGEMLGLARTKYTLREICKVVQVPHLVGDVRTATTYTGSEKVPELVEADIKSQAYTKVSFDLWKNVVHLAISAEAELKSDINVMDMQITDGAKEMARMENSQIATEFEADATSSTGYKWQDKTNGVSDHDPIIDFELAQEALDALGYEGKKIAMNRTQYGRLITNTHITSLLERGTVVKTGQMPVVNGLAISLDAQITDNLVYLIDPEGTPIYLGEGPEMAVQYASDSPKFMTGWAFAKFLEPMFVNANAARKIDCSS